MVPRTRFAFLGGIAAASLLSVGAGFAAADYLSDVGALNPVINYHFDDVSSGTAANQGTGGSTYNGTYHSVTSVSGTFGSAANFAGGQYLSATDSGLPTGTASRSVLFFLTSNQDPGTTYPGLVTYGNYSTNNIFAVLLPSNSDTNFNGSVVGELGESNYGDGIAGTTRITDGVTHFIAVTETQNVDAMNIPTGSATFHLFVDGVDQTPSGVTKSVNTTTNSSELDLGKSNFGNFNGTLDEFAFFNSALTSSQIQTLENDVPEPASLTCLALGGLSLMSRRRRAV